MIFQNVNFGGQIPNGDEVDKMCREHPECKDCPLKTQDMEIGGTMVRCLTGRSNGNT